ncbi:hypothetical protein H671_5g14370 [Cricetulus griseus]|nr:hypothetical protein H671_5g14370 [Cricetulus griseus]
MLPESLPLAYVASGHSSSVSSFTYPCHGQVLRVVEGHSYKHEFFKVFREQLRQLELDGPRRQGNWRRKPGDLLPFLHREGVLEFVKGFFSI